MSARRAAPLFQRAQQRQRDGVIAAERDQVLDARRRALDQLKAADKIAQRQREIADVGDRQLCRIDPMQGMRAVHQHPARVANGARPEAGAAAVGGAEVERNAGNADRRRAIAAPDAEKCRRDRIGGDAGRCLRHDPPGAEAAAGLANRNTAAATAQVQSPLAAPSAAAVIERLSTIRSLIS